MCRGGIGTQVPGPGRRHRRGDAQAESDLILLIKLKLDNELEMSREWSDKDYRPREEEQPVCLEAVRAPSSWTLTPRAKAADPGR
ncbi:hypothetical protein QTO34_003262 [Cnephaeus nilssonii]|uniref:Uncharacterized protein n=1 Tax=Cnephaeus nilssonii TaxID=3371016 RepID=A0AA40LJ54_CNENI|nr:hypothetical protein QTO34_003262 [Eptesicus nilssonii]